MFRITEQQGLEGPFKYHLVHPPHCKSRGALQQCFHHITLPHLIGMVDTETLKVVVF